MAATILHDILKHSLGDLLYAEKAILKELKKLVKETSDDPMARRLQEHHDETETQIERLDRAFSAIGEKARAQKCPGILGILEERKEFKEEEVPTPDMLEAFNFGAGLRVEHYEIAAYRSAIALARALNQDACAALLELSLEEEEGMADYLQEKSVESLTVFAVMEEEMGGAMRD